MKKLTALLALFLLLTLLAQGACAAVKVAIWSRISRPIPQDKSVLYGALSSSDTGEQYKIQLDAPNDDDKFLNQLDDFLNSQSNLNSIPLDPGHTRKALLVDMTLWHKPNSNSDFNQTYIDLNDSNLPLNPVVPLSDFIPEGTTFKNLRVYHAQAQANSSEDYSWNLVNTFLHNGMPQFNSNSIGFQNINVLNTGIPRPCKSDYNLRLTVNHFSPFVIVWDESPAAAPLSVPQTGDSASFAPWLLLLGGACVLLLAKKKSAASA